MMRSYIMRRANSFRRNVRTDDDGAGRDVSFWDRLAEGRGLRDIRRSTAPVGTAMTEFLRSQKCLVTFRLLFGAALIFALVMALLPKPPHLVIDDLGDKFEHSLAFVTLAILAALAFPSAKLMRIGERLSFLGALIEVFQSIPSLHRDCDVMDWVFDNLAIIVALLLIAALRRARKWPSIGPDAGYARAGQMT